jgi:serine/threonine protein phosphatase PrpC
VSVSTPRHVVWPEPAGSRARDSAASRQGTAQGPAQGTESAGAQFSTGGTRLNAAVATSRGPNHAVNEDSHSPIDGAPALFVVADGVGGGAAASYVSKELVAQLHRALAGRRHDAEAVRAALLDADRAIASTLASRTDECGAATVALCARTGTSPSHWLVAWVGDCRIYRVPAGRDADAEAELLTVDDTYRNLGETPPPGGSLDDPSRMVGNGAVDAPNVRIVTLDAGEMLVLCSDGVHKYADARDIVHSLGEPLPLARRCINLIERARTRGSHDDATVLAVQREDHGIGRLARVIATGALVAFVALIAVFLVGDRAAASRPVPTDAFSQPGVQP